MAQSRDDFADLTWGRRALLSPRERLPRDFQDLLDADAVDELVSGRGLRTPFLRVAREGSTIPAGAFTAGGGVGAGVGDQVSDDKLLGLFADGATMVLQGLHRVWPPISQFVRGLAGELGHPVQANAYVTPVQSRGFDDHYDVHDVFVLQVAGAKRWRVHAPVHPSPLRDQPWTDHRSRVREAALEPPLLEVVLRAGDSLYLPRGYLHAATALDEVSIHLTLGVHTWTGQTLADALLERVAAVLAEDPEVRASLGLGVSIGDPATMAPAVEDVRVRLVEAVRAVTVQELAGGLLRQDRASGRSEPVGPLAQVRAMTDLAGPGVEAGPADGASIHDPGWTARGLRLRDQALPLLERDGEGWTLTTRTARVGLTEAEAGAVRRVLAGDADAVMSADLTRRLLAAGVLVPR